MGQRLSRASWNASSNNDPRGLNYTNQYTNNELHQFIDHPTVILEYPHQDEAKTAIVSQTSVSAETSSPSATSASASLSNQVIIRIQLTKMENNNSNDNLEIDDNTNNVSQSAAVISPSTSPSLASAALTRPTSSTSAGTTYPSPDNNLNIPCSGAHIRLTISNICDPPLANSSRTISNNLNIDRNSNPANSQSIQCLNIVEDHHSASNENDFYNSPDNDAWRRTSPDSNRRLTRNTSCTCNGNRMNGGGCAAFNVEGISCSCTGYRKKAIGRDCLSGHSSLCSQSGHEADSRHCCRVKKTSNNYPSKFRCCICRESLANAANNNNSNNRSSSSSPINDADERSYNCRSSNCAAVSSCRNNQAVAVSSQPQTPQNRQIFQHINQPVGQNVIVLSVNSNVPRLIVDSPRFQQEFELVLPAGSVVCSPSASTAGVSGVSGVVSSHFGPMIHSQADYSHCLVPDLEKITNCSFYWGKMDRYEAERLLEGKPEGTFLLRDSAQDEYLFSVTFRKYNRSLHARIEQLGHKFSFDCHDPGVYTASTVTGLLEHYKDPSCVMFFEPMLMIPLHRNFSFSLQQLCRATVVSHITYDGINDLQLPSSLKSYLKEYHYKYKIRETPLDDSLYPSS